MRTQQPLGLPEALRAVAANTSQRMAEIDKLDRYVKGTQYEGRPSWFSTGKPLLERAPCIVYPAAKNAIRSNVALCLGEGKFPRITASPGEDGEELDEDVGLNEADSATLDAFVNGPLKRHARLATVTREILRRAQGEMSCAAIVCARGGRLCVDTVSAKVSTPEFVENGKPNEVLSLEIRYPYLDEYWDNAANTWAVRAMLFRRVIDATRDVTYLPLIAADTGKEPADDLWREDPKKTFEHGLGRCPVIWYPHGGRKDDCVDGYAIHEGLLDELDALNFSLSQKHRAALYSGDPQIVETGVDLDHNPSIDGSTAFVYVEHDGNGGRFLSRPHGGEGGEPARRKGAGTVWRYPAVDSKVAMLSLPPGALEAIENDARDIKSKIDESMAVVFLDPGNSALRMGELSGSAIRKLYLRQTSNCDEIREDFGENGLLALVDMLLWFIATVVGRGEKLNIMGVKRVTPVLAKFITSENVVTDAEMSIVSRWSPPELFLRWGEYFDDSAEDELARVRVASEAKSGGLVPLECAVEKVAPVFGIQNPHEVAEQLEAKAAEEQAALTEAMGAHNEMNDDGASAPGEVA